MAFSKRKWNEFINLFGLPRGSVQKSFWDKIQWIREKCFIEKYRRDLWDNYSILRYTVASNFDFLQKFMRKILGEQIDETLSFVDEGITEGEGIPIRKGDPTITSDGFVKFLVQLFQFFGIIQGVKHRENNGIRGGFLSRNEDIVENVDELKFID